MGRKRILLYLGGGGQFTSGVEKSGEKRPILGKNSGKKKKNLVQREREDERSVFKGKAVYTCAGGGGGVVRVCRKEKSWGVFHSGGGKTDSHIRIIACAKHRYPASSRGTPRNKKKKRAIPFFHWGGDQIQITVPSQPETPLCPPHLRGGGFGGRREESARWKREAISTLKQRH